MYINHDDDNQMDVSTPQQELDVNRKNREDFENLMKESSTQLDGYWDKNNIFVKILLLGLGIFIIVGVLYYVMAYLGTK